MTEVGLSVIAMWDCVKADFEANWVSTPDNERLKRVAIALCVQEGQPPDEIVMGIPNKDSNGLPTIVRCGYGTVAIRTPIQPCWVGYVGLARAAISACDVAK